MTRHRQTGVTLLELMIVAVIITILAGIAYPSYTRYVIRANKVEAQEFMLNVASRAEQYRMDARNYPADLAALGMTVPPGVNENYTVTLAGNNGTTPPSFLIEAVAKAGSPQAGESTLGLNSSGVKTPPGEW